jgi:SAM-dependent methyltransferase
MKFFKLHWLDYFPYRHARVHNKRVLHIGSGKQKFEGASSLDIDKSLSPDIAWDMNVFPWPIDDKSFDEVIAINILEHVEDLVLVLNEIHRILKPSGKLYILVPHFTNYAAYVDPTHRQHLSYFSFDYFISGTSIEKDYGFYVNFRFILKRRVIMLSGRFLNFILFYFVNTFPLLWEKYFCFIIRGEGLYLELQREN